MHAVDAGDRDKLPAPRVRAGSDGFSLAVVLSGIVRSFVTPLVHVSMRKNIIDALCAGQSCSGWDIFACGDLGTSAMGDVVRSPPARRDLFRKAFADFSTNASRVNLSLTSVNSSEASGQLQISCKNALRWCNGPGRGAVCEGQHVSGAHRAAPGELGLLRQAQCFERVLQSESRRRRAYDWVVFLRFDVAFFHPIPPLASFALRGEGVFVADNHVMHPLATVYNLSASSPRLSSFSDHFAVVSRRFAVAYARAHVQGCCRPCWQHARDVDHRLQPWTRGSGEEFLATQLNVHRVPVHFGFYPSLLVRVLTNRSLFSAECFRQASCCAHTQPGAFRTANQLGQCWPPCRPRRMAECAAAVNEHRSDGVHACMRWQNPPIMRRDRCGLESSGPVAGQTNGSGTGRVPLSIAL